MKRFLGLLTLILSYVCLCLMSCNSSPDSIDNSSSDSIDTSPGKGKVYYASKDLSTFTLRAVRGTGDSVTYNNTTVSDIFVVKGDALETLSEEDTILALRTCLSGKTIVIDCPTLAQLDAFWTKIQTLLEDEKYEFLKAEHELSPYTIYDIIVNYGSDASDDEDFTKSADEHVYEAIGLRQGNVYFVHDIDEVVDAASGHTYKGARNSQSEDHTFDEDGNPTTTGTAIDTDHVASSDTDWDEIINQTAELFSAWLKGESSSKGDEACKNAALVKLGREDAQEALANVKKAQTITFTYTVGFSCPNSEHYDGRLNGKKEVVQTYFDVWTACDITNQTEYYLVRTSVVFNNQQLQGIHGFSYDSQTGYEGPYLDWASVDVTLPGGILRVADCSPQNASGSTTFTAGSSFSIGGNIGGTAVGPTGGVSFGLTISESTSRSIPDTTIIFSPTVNVGAGSDKAAWRISTPEITLRKDENFFWNSKWLCDGAKVIQNNTATFDFYSLYTRPSDYDKKNKNAMFEINLTTCLGATTVWKNNAPYFPYPEYTHYGHSRWVLHHLPFTRPNNLMGEYIMGFVAPNGSSQNEISLMNTIMKEYFSEWNTNVNYYAFGDNSSADTRDSALDSVAGNYFTTIKQKMTANQNVIKNRGIKGSYTFYIQRVHDGKQIKDFAMTF